MRLDQRRSSFADYEKLYEAYPDSLGARLPLCRMTSDNRNFDIGDIDNEADLLAVKARIDKITAALEASLRQYPDVYGKEFQNVLTQLSKPKVQIIAGTLCAPGKPTEVKVLAINAPKIELAAFRRLIEGDDLPATKLFANSKPPPHLPSYPIRRHTSPHAASPSMPENTSWRPVAENSHRRRSASPARPSYPCSSPATPMWASLPWT